MNLADAIRQAAQRQAEEHGPKEPTTMSNAGPTPEPQVPAPSAEVSEKSTAEEPKPVKSADSAPKTTPTPAREPNLTVHHVNKDEKSEDTPVANPEWGHDTGRLTFETAPEDARRLFAADSATGEPVELPEAPLGSSGNGNAVRFEIFLSPEQLSCLFRALVATQHSMMTMREAASYLRITAGALEQLAQEGKIPALQIEGRWRFPKSGIDEWVMLQSFREAEVEDAA